LSINALYEHSRSGDKTAEKLLFENLAVSFSVFVRHRTQSPDDVHEVVQEALTTIAAKYRDIEFETSFSAWAYKILEHKLLHYYRAEGQRRARFVTTANQRNDAAYADIDPTLRRRLLDCLKMVSQTRLRHARVLTLHFQGYSIKEICHRLGVTTNNLYVMLSRARTMLKTCLEKGGIE